MESGEVKEEEGELGLDQVTTSLIAAIHLYEDKLRTFEDAKEECARMAESTKTLHEYLKKANRRSSDVALLTRAKEANLVKAREMIDKSEQLQRENNDPLDDVNHQPNHVDQPDHGHQPGHDHQPDHDHQIAQQQSLLQDQQKQLETERRAKEIIISQKKEIIVSQKSLPADKLSNNIPSSTKHHRVVKKKQQVIK